MLAVHACHIVIVICLGFVACFIISCFHFKYLSLLLFIEFIKKKKNNNNNNNNNNKIIIIMIIIIKHINKQKGSKTQTHTRIQNKQTKTMNA